MSDLPVYSQVMSLPLEPPHHSCKFHNYASSLSFIAFDYYRFFFLIKLKCVTHVLAVKCYLCLALYKAVGCQQKAEFIFLPTLFEQLQSDFIVLFYQGS